MHVRLPGDLYLPSPLGRFRVPVVGRQAGGHSSPARHLVNFGSPAVPSPGAETGSAPSYEQPTSIWRLDRLPALQTLWEPEMGANVFSRPRT